MPLLFSYVFNILIFLYITDVCLELQIERDGDGVAVGGWNHNAVLTCKEHCGRRPERDPFELGSRDEAGQGTNPEKGHELYSKEETRKQYVREDKEILVGNHSSQTENCIRLNHMKLLFTCKNSDFIWFNLMCVCVCVCVCKGISWEFRLKKEARANFKVHRN